MDNTPYFLERVKLYPEPTYKVTFEDYVRVRDLTTGIVVTELVVEQEKKPICLKISDVGGQKTERRKWLHLFDGTNVVLWVMSLASYDQTLFEDNMKNRYDDAFELFETHCHDKNFKNTEFVVFMNKHDLFLKKLATVPFTKYAPDFDESKAQDPEAVIKYVQERHEDIFHKKDGNAILFFHVTCATDNTKIESVISTVKYSWMKKGLEANAFM